MIIVLSPAKSIDFESKPTTRKHTQPDFMAETEQLVAIMQNYSPAQLSKLMGISDKLAQLNVARYGSFETPFGLANAKQAVLSFTGDVYQGLDATSLDAKSLDYAQKRLRIISGLYGLLRPLDLMQPYRLEMGTKLKTKVKNKQGKNLYDFWGDKLNQTVQGLFEKDRYPVLVNCASKEYFTALNLKNLPQQVITPTFKDWKNGQYKHINFYAKKARGLLARYAIDHKALKPEDLKGFDYEGYRFSEADSTETDWVFLRKL
jgi:uncharacterized protein